MRSLLVLAFALAAVPAFAQIPEAAEPSTFRIYTADGAPASFDSLTAAFVGADVVFLGEQHNDPVAHALQLDLLRAATVGERPVALSLEMFEQDVQLVLDEYLAGLIRERDFLAAARPWSNYDSDYRPLVEHARANGQPVLAANAPARYVRLVSQRGVGVLAQLPLRARAFLPTPVVPASEALADKFLALMGSMMGHGGGSSADSSAASSHTAHGSGMPSLDGMLAAQNLRDVGMADAIAQHRAAEPDALVLHVTGSFHSEGGLGIPEHLARLRPGDRVLIVTMVPASALDAFDLEAHAGLGDFVVLTDASLPRTYEAGF
ncbi:MAG: ChaN family lipoprotein [Bacteroidota bacterium]